MTTPEPPAAVIRDLVIALFRDSGLEITEHPFEITVTNPRDRERGTIHIATDDGYVSWEQSLWRYWGILEGGQDPAGDEAVVTARRIIATLTEPPSPLAAATISP